MSYEKIDMNANPFADHNVSPIMGIKLADNNPGVTGLPKGHPQVFLYADKGLRNTLSQSGTLEDLDELIIHATALREHLAAKIKKELTTQQKIAALQVGQSFSLYKLGVVMVKVSELEYFSTGLQTYRYISGLGDDDYPEFKVLTVPVAE